MEDGPHALAHGWLRLRSAVTASRPSTGSRRGRRARPHLPLGVTVLSGVAVLFFALPFAARRFLIVERRRPQDGQISIDMAARPCCSASWISEAL